MKALLSAGAVENTMPQPADGLAVGVSPAPGLAVGVGTAPWTVTGATLLRLITSPRLSVTWTLMGNVPLDGRATTSVVNATTTYPGPALLAAGVVNNAQKHPAPPLGGATRV